jgi:hypothetical protein
MYAHEAPSPAQRIAFVLLKNPGEFAAAGAYWEVEARLEPAIIAYHPAHGGATQDKASLSIPLACEPRIRYTQGGERRRNWLS